MSGGFCPRTIDDDFAKQGFKESLKQKLATGLKLKSFYDSRQKKEFLALLSQIRKSGSVLNRISNERLLQILAQTDRAHFLKKVADELCLGGKFVPATLGLPMFFKAPHYFNLNFGLFRTIDQQLDQNNPVAVDYYMSFFNGWNRSIESDERHASVIVGREMKNGVCKYKLRNSWGDQCRSSDGSNKYKNPDFDAKTGGCENGNLWVSKDQFRHYLYGVTYIEK